MKLDNHIDTKELKQFVSNGVQSDTDMSILEHISSCNFCNEAYVRLVEEDLLSMPTDLEEEIISKVKNRNVISFQEKKRYFYRYCVRVGVACACSILLLFTMDGMVHGNIMNKVAEKNITKLFQGTFDDLKQHIYPMEVDDYENETK